MILEIDNVELSFSNRTILSGVYIKAETGKVTGILGSNGSGKSCLLHIAFGSLKPKYKLVRLDGKPITKALYATGKARLLPQFSFIPNTFKIFKAFQLYNVDWDDFVAVFESFKIYKNSKMRYLSGGERRVIEIYLSLKSSNSIVFLDEPFSHLSPIYIEKIMALIGVEKYKKIILITDHMYRQILDISDTLYLLHQAHSKRINNPKELERYGYLNPGTID